MLETLSEHFDRTTLERGYGYFVQRRATILAERRDGLEVSIEAICAGSRPKPYAQDVLLLFGDDGRLDLVEGECSCPVQTDCKHVACVALSWLSTRPAPRAETRSADADRARTGIEPEPVLLAPQAREWLQGFERSVKRPAAAELKGECLCYRLSTDGRTLGLVRGRVLKSGRLSAPQGFTPDFGWLYAGREPPRYVGAADLPVLEAIARLRMAEHRLGWNLEGAHGAQALEAALASGRLRVAHAREWRSYEPLRDELYLGSAAGWLRRGEARSATLALAPDAGNGSRWRVLVTPARGAESLAPIPVAPPWYLDAGRQEVGRLEIAGPQAAIEKMLCMPQLEASEAPIVLAAVHRLASGAGMTEVAALVPAEMTARIAPRARLRIARGLFQEPWQPRAAREARWIAELWFDYAPEISAAAADAPAPGLRWRAPGGEETLVVRDLEAEREVLRRIAAAGCRFRHPRSDPRAFRIDAERMYGWPGDGSEAAWRAGIGKLVQAADAAGAVTEMEGEFPFKITDPGPEAFYEELAPADAAGWFDLDLGVVIEGRRVSLAAALAGWIRATADFAGWLRDAESRPPALLDAGPAGLVRLPAARLKRLLEPLLETFAFERPGDAGLLRLSRLEAALLPQLDGAAAVQEKLAALRARLRGFRGVAPAPPAPGFAGKLRPYQQSGLDWLQFLREHELAGILADDMGLGKTVQALAHLDLEKAAGRAGRPSLVVAPTSVLPNWREEAGRFAPRLRVLLLHGAGRRAQQARIAESDLVLTSYPLLLRDRAALERCEYHLLVFDEAQFIKNAGTQVYGVAAALKARHRLALTGTPIENNLAELWAHFNLLLPGFLGDARQFARRWRTPIEKEGGEERMARLAQRVRPLVLRRTRGEVLDELPPRTEIVQHVELEGAQRDLYESLRIALDDKLRRAIAAKGIAGSQIVILDALLKLRQACCDPRLVKSPAAKAAHDSSAKLESLRGMLAELRAEGKRTLLFSQFTSMLDLIEAELPALGVRHVRLSGDTQDRLTPVKVFQAGETDLFLISLRAGGTGLNLTAADTVIHYDPWWNPAVEAQATARAHRIGQDKSVFVFKLIAARTVEERILALLKRKQALADALLGEGRASAPLISEEDVRVLLAPIAASN